MQGCAVVVAFLAIGYGFAAGGLVGALTGLVAALGVGSGLAISAAEQGTDVEGAGPLRTAQRIGGILAAAGCLAGVIRGGWSTGWLWGIGGYLAGAATSLVVLAPLLAVRKVRSRDERQPAVATAWPASFDLNDASHVALIDRISDAYSALLQDQSHPHAACMYSPASLLPYPRPVIKTALTALREFAERRRESRLLDPHLRNADAAETFTVALLHLDNFLDVPAHQLPTDPIENAEEALKRGVLRNPDDPTVDHENP